MISESKVSPNRENQTSKDDAGDVIAKNITATVVGMLSRFCRWFSITPESIKTHKPGVRPNSPPHPAGLPNNLDPG